MLQLWDRDERQLPGPEKEKAGVLVEYFSGEGEPGARVQAILHEQ